ncbi:MAG: CoA transferase [Chloroflexi bacterium]|nr:CoA transferase [Chloroflexota bacterium]
MTGPLDSLKILDFSTLLPGPYATMFLADLGADVVRIEAPNRPDIVRLSPPLDGDTSAWHGLLNRSKRSLALDLKKPGGSDVVKRLVETYDIVLEQFRPGVMDRLGVGYEELKAVNPKLIYCALTGYGQTGPYRDRAGHDINYLSLAGVSSHTGRKEHGPFPMGLQVADVGAGSYNVMVGILAAEIHRRETGEGQFVDVSMYDGSLAWNAQAASHFFVSGDDPEWEGMWLNGGSYYDYYRTRDGRYLSVGSLEPQFWEGFCQAIERPDLIKRGYSLDLADQRQLKTAIQKTIASRDFDDWLEVFAAVDVCVEPVLNLSEVVDHSQFQAREMLIEIPKTDGGLQRQIGNPIKFSRGESVYKFAGAPVGVHAQEILEQSGFSQTEIQSLAEAGILG